MKTIKEAGASVTNYDGIAKRLLDNMDDGKMIKFISYVFGRTFEENSTVTRMATETYDRETKQRRCDYYVKINDGMFLIEIQSYEDDEMALRIFEYGSRGAMLHRHKNKDDDIIDIQFPEPVVFYLRKGEKVHDRLSVRVHRSGSSEEYTYDAKVVYVEDYGMNELIETGMLPLIPFYPMRYEKILNRKHSTEDEKAILNDFDNSYRNLKSALETGKLGSEYYQYLKESMINVFGGVVERMKRHGKMKAEKEANKLMQKMVDDPIEMFDIFKAIEFYQEKGLEEGRKKGMKIGREEGRAEGRVEGEQRGRKIMKYLMKNFSEKDTDEIICSGLAAEFGLSEEEALKYLNDFRE